jgi:hypothetical protein
MEVLTVVAILASYGRHLAETLEQRAVLRSFATIARFFGTAATDTILAHIRRGLMRAFALQRMLLRRSDRGGDMTIPALRASSGRSPPGGDMAEAAGLAPSDGLTPEQEAAVQMAAAHAAARREAAKLARLIAGSAPLTLDNLPLMSVIDAEVRRSPVGRTIAAICRDLGISPSLCTGAFWNRVFEGIWVYGGSVCSLTLEVKRREVKFGEEEWKHPELALP